MAKSKISWEIKAFIAGTTGGIIMYILFPYWKLALISAVITFVIVILNNPQRVFLMAFYKLTFLLVLFNQPYFEFKGKIGEHSYKIGNTQFTAPENIFLMFLIGLALILHFWYNKKLKASLINIDKSVSATNSENINTGNVNTKGGDFRIGNNQ